VPPRQSEEKGTSVRLSPSRDAGRQAGKSSWHWLLVLPILIPLTTPAFNRMEPRLGGMPFFYWSQLGLIGFAMLITTVVHLATKHR